MLIEKAYAKIYGNYSVIEGGNPAVALNDLTGAPYENLNEGTDDEFWNYILENDKKQFVLTCYTKEGQSQEAHDVGLVEGHAYAILNA